MRAAIMSQPRDRLAGRVISVVGLVCALVAGGCGGKEKTDYTSVSEPPTVRVIQPAFRTIVRSVGQPGFIQSYERTSIYPKLSAYIEKWFVDIGDKVKKGDVLATLFVPELVEDFATKKATVVLEQRRIELAKKAVEVSSADLDAARARVAQARASLARFQAETERWDSEVKRLTREVERGVVNPQDLLQSTNRFKASTASRDAARSAVEKVLADELAREADLAKAQVDVEVASDRLAVADSDEKRLEAWMGYLTLTAPFDGIIVVRNANTFDFVLPSTGDPTAMPRAPDLSARGAAPIYVVDRTDIVRVFIDLPEQDASYVKVGAKASVLIRGFRDRELEGTVTRTAWALNVKSRTMRVEIDLPNTDARILPGMYAYGRLTIERPNVRALPLAALVHTGDTTYCWRLEDGKAVRLEIETGLQGDDWIEVTNRRVARSPSTPADAPAWKPIDGSEQVILGELSILRDGTAVKIDDQPATTNVANAPPAKGAR